MSKSELAARNFAERSKVAAQIKKIRAYERNHDIENDLFEWNRNIYEYLDKLGGISVFLNFIKDSEGKGVLLDIGAGTCLGLSQIADTKAASGLDIIATVLTTIPSGIDLSSRVRRLKTVAETLRGIEDNSVNGILAVASIGYSDSPEMVVSSINKKLVDGGVVKAAFRPISNNNETVISLGFKTHHEFSSKFRDLGYDVAVRGKDVDEDVMIAIKPGGFHTPFNSWGDVYNAEQLLNLDAAYGDFLLLNEGKL